MLAEVKSWPAESSGGRASEESEGLAWRLRGALDTIEDGRCKLYVTYAALQFRRANESLFRDGSYVPLRVTGSQAAHVLAFARRLEDQLTIVAVPRLYARLMESQETFPLGANVWHDTRIHLPSKLTADSLRNTLDDATVQIATDVDGPSMRAAEVFAHFPVALLTN